VWEDAQDDLCIGIEVVDEVSTLAGIAQNAWFSPEFCRSWRAATRQLRANLEVSNKQIIAPMRQAWINNLRDLLSEITSSALHYHVAGFEERTDQEYQHLTHLEYKIRLMLNPRETDHQQLEKLIAQMTGLLGKKGSPDVDAEFQTCHEAVVALAREVFKREWDRVKESIPMP
jgi:hypothetical protein